MCYVSNKTSAIGSDFKKPGRLRRTAFQVGSHPLKTQRVEKTSLINLENMSGTKKQRTVSGCA